MVLLYKLDETNFGIIHLVHTHNFPLIRTRTFQKKQITIFESLSFYLYLDIHKRAHTYR